MINKISEKKAIELLSKYSSGKTEFEIVYRHSKAVQKVAIKLSRKAIKNGLKIDLNFVRIASLLHDIGRFDCPPGDRSIFHGIIGAKILKKEGISVNFRKVCERHLGPGIKKTDVINQKLPIPAQNYVPKSYEEKIICYADNIIVKGADGQWDKLGKIEDTYKRYLREANADVAKRIILLHEEVIKMIGKK